jgi:acyl-CoA thioesterase-2
VSTADFDELLAVLDLKQIADDMFVGSHPSKNPVRTFGGQMMAQAFVAGSRTVSEKLPPSNISTHFIAGGDPEKDLEFQVVRLRDERRFANRRVDHGDGLLPCRRSEHRAWHRTARAAGP